MIIEYAKILHAVASFADIGDDVFAYYIDAFLFLYKSSYTIERF